MILLIGLGIVFADASGKNGYFQCMYIYVCKYVCMYVYNMSICVYACMYLCM